MVGEELPEVGICVLTLNSADTVGYVLKLLLADDYPRSKLRYLVVDGGSSDGTLEVVRGTFEEVSDVRYSISVLAGSNIPQARNECLDRLTKEGVDYVLFVDSDVLVAVANAIRKLVELAGRRSLVYIPVLFKYFRSSEELRRFVEGLKPTEVELSQRDLVPSLRIGMGFTLIPRGLAASLRFDEDLDFGEDHLYAIKALGAGYTPYAVSRELPVYDVNLAGSRGDIYWRIPIRRYLMSPRKKVLRILVACVEDGTLRFSYRKLPKVLAKHLANAGLLALFVLLPLLALADLRLFVAAALTRLSITLGYVVRRKLSGFSLVEALKNRFKFELYSALVLVNFPLAYRDLLKMLQGCREAPNHGYAVL